MGPIEILGLVSLLIRYAPQMAQTVNDLIDLCRRLFLEGRTTTTEEAALIMGAFHRLAEHALARDPS